jgi:hypothetical protein
VRAVRGERDLPSASARGLSRKVWPVVPLLSTAQSRPAAASRSASVGTSRIGAPVCCSNARNSSTSPVSSRRRGSSGWASWFATNPCRRGRQPVATEDEQTRVSDGNTERAWANCVPMAAKRSRFGVVSGRTMSGRSPSNTTSRKESIRAALSIASSLDEA